MYTSQEKIGFSKARKPRKNDINQLLMDSFLSIKESREKEKLPPLFFQQYAPMITCLYCYPDQIRRLFANAINSIYRHTLTSKIYIECLPTHLKYRLELDTGHSIRVPAVRVVITMNDSFPVLPKSYTFSPCYEYRLAGRSNRKKSLLEINEEIAQDHYSLMDVNRYPPKEIHTYVFPVNFQTLLNLVNKHSTYASAVVCYSAYMKTTYIEEEAFLRVLSKHPAIDTELISDAIHTAKYYHRKQTRRSGGPFYLHPISVANILLAYTQKSEVLAAAILHDTIEDTNYTLHQLKENFGSYVTGMVEGLSNFHCYHRRSLLVGDKEPGARFILEHAPLEVQQIKLADRLHNMRTLLGHASPSKRYHIAKQTAEFFIPLAKKIKMKPLAEELEKLCKENLG